MHFNLQPLLFSHDHNARNSCATAYAKYSAAQRIPFTCPDRVIAADGQTLPTECGQPARSKKRKFLQTTCQCLDATASSTPAATDQDQHDQRRAENLPRWTSPLAAVAWPRAVSCGVRMWWPTKPAARCISGTCFRARRLLLLDKSEPATEQTVLSFWPSASSSLCNLCG